MELPGRRLATSGGRPSHPTLSDDAAVPARFLLCIDGPGNGARNMAVDEALMGLARAGATTLRFYTWEPDCLSLGRNQTTPERIQERSRDELRPGEDIVRRPTGGRSVYHSRELTYSVTSPDRLWGGPRRMYRRINAALHRGLTALGASLDPIPGFDPALPLGPASGLDPREEAAGPPPQPTRHGGPGTASGLGPLGSRPCFQEPAHGEVTAGGRKLVGSAQWRHRGVLLQHGSILLLNEQAWGNLDAGRGDRPESAAIGLSELVREMPEPAHLIRTLSESFGTEFGSKPEPAVLDPALETEARELEKKYRSGAWTWRR